MITFTIEKPNEVAFEIPNVDLGADAFDKGYEAGEKDGYLNGYEAGAKEGAEVGYAKGEQEGYTKGYEKGTHDGEDNALDAFNRNLQGTGIEYAESVDEIDGKFEEATQQQYDNGVEIGRVEGKQAEYDRFWDAYQKNGNRTDYQYAFYGEGWGSIFTPKYDLKPIDATCMFLKSNIRDLETSLKNSGVVLDTSNCTNAFRMFHGIGSANDCFETVPELDLRKATNIGELFGYAEFKIVRKIILNDSGTQDTSTVFHGGMQCLEEIRFEGVIGRNLRLQWSGKLSDASVQSVIDHLKDLTGATAQTLTFHADVGAKLTQAQKDAISAKNWTLVY